MYTRLIKKEVTNFLYIFTNACMTRWNGENTKSMYERCCLGDKALVVECEVNEIVKQ